MPPRRGGACNPRPGGPLRFFLLPSLKDASYRPCGAGLFCRLASRGRHLRLWRKRPSRRPAGRPGAFFSLVRKEAKAPSRDVPSLENPSHYGGYLFALRRTLVVLFRYLRWCAGLLRLPTSISQCLPLYTLNLPGFFSGAPPCETVGSADDVVG